MPRRRRLIKSNRCYEICFRAENTLPFVAYKTISFMIGAILARVQRDDKLVICHDIWNGSHVHIIVIVKCAKACVDFYAELQKKITDAFKRLLGKKRLSIWEGRVTVAEIADLDKAIDRIAYLYANPAQDNLEDSIDKFPGFSSWRTFNSSTNSISSCMSEEYPWIKLPSIPRVNSNKLSISQDRNLIKLFKRRNKDSTHTFTRYPNAWMKCFGVSRETEVSRINKEIIKQVRGRETKARERRESEGKQVMGAHRLTTQAILARHTPKKRERKIFLLCSKRELRIALIRSYKEFSEECRRCYEAWKRGDFSISWPPGAFKPPLPPNTNVIPLYC